jgi:hypothetical protein
MVIEGNFHKIISSMPKIHPFNGYESNVFLRILLVLAIHYLKPLLFSSN